MIISYEVKNGMIKVLTDQSARGFVYPVDRFGSLEELEAEIAKSISVEVVRKEKRDTKFLGLSSELQVAGAVDNTVRK